MSPITDKQCRKCGQAKPISDFYKKRKSPDGYDYWCKKCTNERNKKLFKERYRYYRIAQNNRNRNQKTVVLQELTMALGGMCQKCSYNSCLAALDFHHVNPDEKTISVADAVGQKKFDLARKEADKCVLLCSNCHRELEYGFWRPTPDFVKREGMGYQLPGWEIVQTADKPYQHALDGFNKAQ